VGGETAVALRPPQRDVVAGLRALMDAPHVRHACIARSRERQAILLRIVELQRNERSGLICARHVARKIEREARREVWRITSSITPPTTTGIPFRATIERSARAAISAGRDTTITVARRATVPSFGIGTMHGDEDGDRERKHARAGPAHPLSVS